LFTHPHLNDFMTSLKACSRERVASKVKGYMDSHPDEQADMANIRQPLVDLKAPPLSADPGSIAAHGSNGDEQCAEILTASVQP
jgi:hypothetical protein